MSNQERTPRGRELAELARRQHGVISARQLAELGYARATISSAVKRGRLHSVHRGVYAVGHMALSWEGRCLAAVLARPGSVASHVTAAWMHGLLRSRPGTIHLTASTRQRRKRDFVVHFARLLADDVMTVDGILVTSPARTMLDLAPDESTRDLGRLLRRADERELLDRRRFEALLSRAGGHPGRAKFAAPAGSYKSSAGRAFLRAREPRHPLIPPIPFSAGRVLRAEHAASAGGAPMGDPRGAQAALPPSTVGEIGVTGPAAATLGPFLAGGAPSGTVARMPALPERRRRTIGPRRSVA